MSKRGKKKFRGPQPRPAVKPDEPTINKPNLGFFNASTVVTKEWTTIQVVLAGCGGIGVWMAMHIARIMRVLYEDNKGFNFTICDPDRVEEKNLGRQYFCDAEIGQPKAVAVASRLGRAFGLNTMAVVEPYHERFLYKSDLTVLVGCVDRPEGRAALSDTLRHNPDTFGADALPSIWWLDCGNNRDAGRVLLGNARGNEQMRGAFLKGKRCIALPSPALQFPSLLAPQEGENRDMSCAELAAQNLQSLNINAAVAVQAADMLTRLLITKDLRRYACAINVEAGAVKSYYVTPEQVARDIRKPESYVLAADRCAPARMEAAEPVAV
jgi:PRTRC genetic system ThiF family protein